MHQADGRNQAFQLEYKNETGNPGRDTCIATEFCE